MIQQPLFILKPAAIANQVAVLADHAVTGNNNSNWVLTIGKAHSADGFDIAHL